MDYAYKDGTAIMPNKDVVGRNGAQHPARILTEWSCAELKAIGVIPYRVIYKNRDPILYDLSDAVTEIGAGEVTVTHGGVERPLADAKAALIESVKNSARRLLNNNDWYVVRLAEKSIALPAPITTYRDAVRAVTSTVEDEVGAAAYISDLAAITIAWPDEV